MATAGNPSTLHGLANELERHVQTVWERFSPEERSRMVADDLEAGKRVSMILISVITAGMLLGIGALVVVLATS